MADFSLPAEVHQPGLLVVRVCGSRHYDDEWTLMDWLDQIHDRAEERNLQVVVQQWNKAGADAIARDWVKSRQDMEIDVLPPRLEMTPRNLQADICLATPGGHDTGLVVQRHRALGILIINVV